MTYPLMFVLQIFLVFSLNLSAEELKTFKLKTGSVSFAVPAKWNEAKNLFGIQLTLLGPENGTSRPVITVESTEFSEFKFDSESLKNNDESYQVGRKNWLSKYDGEVKEFYHYQTKKIMDGKADDHIVGFRYRLNADEFVERSHYIKCKKNLYHLKVLLLAKEETKYQNEIEKIFTSFKCIE